MSSSSPDTRRKIYPSRCTASRDRCLALGVIAKCRFLSTSVSNGHTAQKGTRARNNHFRRRPAHGCEVRGGLCRPCRSVSVQPQSARQRVVIKDECSRVVWVDHASRAGIARAEIARRIISRRRVVLRRLRVPLPRSLPSMRRDEEPLSREWVEAAMNALVEFDDRLNFTHCL